MEPIMYLVFVPICIVMYVIFSWLNGEDFASTIIHTGLFTIIAIGGTTYYQAASKAAKEMDAAETARVNAATQQAPLSSEKIVIPAEQ
jgi:hypothetical protein